MKTVFLIVLYSMLLPSYAQAEARLNATTTKTIDANRAAIQLELEAINEADQKHRKLMQKVVDKTELAALWEKQSAIDKANQVRLGEIVKVHGWPGQKEFGAKAATAAFLVVQHSSLEMMKRYHPILKVAAEDGEARKESFALLEDRIRMYEGRPQLYGSQLQRDEKTGKLNFWAIENEVDVDARRVKMGMPPIAQYAKFFGLEYVPIADRVNNVLPSTTEEPTK